jgi:hypothetical protein
MLSFVLLNYNMLSVVNDFNECHYALCHRTKCRGASEKNAIEKAFQIFQNIKTNSDRLHLLDPGLR